MWQRKLNNFKLFPINKNISLYYSEVKIQITLSELYNWMCLSIFRIVQLQFQNIFVTHKRKIIPKLRSSSVANTMQEALDSISSTKKKETILPLLSSQSLFPISSIYFFCNWFLSLQNAFKFHENWSILSVLRLLLLIFHCMVYILWIYLLYEGIWVYFVLFFKTASLWSPCCPETHSVDQAGLKHKRSTCPPSAGIKRVCYHARLCANICISTKKDHWNPSVYQQKNG